MQEAPSMVAGVKRRHSSGGVPSGPEVDLAGSGASAVFGLAAVRGRFAARTDAGAETSETEGDLPGTGASAVFALVAVRGRFAASTGARGEGDIPLLDFRFGSNA